jgi:CSLREA domain-containing protein
VVVCRASRQQAGAPARSAGRNYSALDRDPVTPASTITVNSTSDAANDTDGLCTLREAITAANNNLASGAVPGECAAGGGGSDTINFSVTGTIVLTSRLPTILTFMSIDGPGADQLTVQRSTASGTPDFSIFAIYSYSTPDETASISGLTITNGKVAYGAGIFNSANLTLTNCVISGNTAAATGGAGTGGSSRGGGIFSHINSVLNVVNSTISGNTSQALGGGAGSGPAGISSMGVLNMVNSTVSGNTGGAAISTDQGGNITNCTISGNSGPLGGNNVILRNTIVANNAGVDTGGLNFVSQGHNLIGIGGPNFVDGVNGDKVGTAQFPLNPVLGPLQNNGGPTLTHALLPGSPAIDAGDNCVTQAAHCGDANIPQLTTDQRGTVNRSIDGDGDGTAKVDIGAYESRGGFSISATSGTAQSAVIGTPFANPLVVTVSSALGEPVVGGVVTFTGPASGPSINSASAAINASNQASAVVTANTIAGGPYNASAGAKGFPNTVTFSLTNTKAVPAIAVSSSLNPSDPGQSVIFTAAVSSPARTPTGTVQFKDNGVNIGGPVILSVGGFAQQITSFLTQGTHTITADYSGDTNFLANSGTLAGGQVVRSHTLSVNDVSITEGDSGTKMMSFTVTLSPASDVTVWVDLVTANGTAAASSDYVARSTTVTFNSREVSKTVDITVIGDQAFEADETLFANLTNPINASVGHGQGTGTIVNDDAQGGILNLEFSSYNVSESAGLVTINVKRTGDVSFPATVDYATDDTGAPAVCSTSNGKASSRCDFTTAAGTLKFAPGDTSRSFNVLVSQDAYLEGGFETFGVALTNPTGGAVFGVPSTATVSIVDSTQGPFNPIDDTQYFVRQHYHDFLNREPDLPGWTFWINQITSCGSNAQCTEARRIDVSASFFLSIEFQQTGYLVERFYKTAYGNAMGTSQFPSNHQLSVPKVRFDEFLRDTQRIGQGVVVLQQGWEQALEANKQAYALEFVQTSRFINAYPTTLTPAEFVDRLDFFAGNPLSPSERTTAINLFGGAANSSNPTARSRAVRQVADDQDLYNAEFNHAFVLAEYFGYLRRNPNDAPEQTLDYTGYDFWLTKLNQFNGNYINAEMVKAFLSSIEYRQRFGP